MTKLLTTDLRSTAPQMLGSRGTPSQFVLYSLTSLCAKFDAFTRFVTIFPLTDRTINRVGVTSLFALKEQKYLNIIDGFVWFAYGVR